VKFLHGLLSKMQAATFPCSPASVLVVFLRYFDAVVYSTAVHLTYVRVDRR